MTFGMEADRGAKQTAMSNVKIRPHFCRFAGDYNLFRYLGDPTG